MLTYIRNSGRVLHAITNGGHKDSILVGDFPSLGEVWLNGNSIANISLTEVRKVCRVIMDTSTEPALLVHCVDGSVMKFVEHPSGLYIYKFNHTNVPLPGYSSYTMVSTIASQKEMFSQRNIKAADAARELYCKIGHPAEVQFQRILKQHLIMNCRVTPTTATWAHIIYGPDVVALKGKTTRSAGRADPTTIWNTTATSRFAQNSFFRGPPFFHTISRGIGFRTAAPVPDQTKCTILRYGTPSNSTPHTASMSATSMATTSSRSCPSAFTLFPPTATLARSSVPFALSRSACDHVLMAFLLRGFPDSWLPTWCPTPCAV